MLLQEFELQLTKQRCGLRFLDWLWASDGPSQVGVLARASNVFCFEDFKLRASRISASTHKASALASSAQHNPAGHQHIGSAPCLRRTFDLCFPEKWLCIQGAGCMIMLLWAPLMTTNRLLMPWLKSSPSSEAS